MVQRPSRRGRAGRKVCVQSKVKKVMKGTNEMEERMDGRGGGVCRVERSAPDQPTRWRWRSAQDQTSGSGQVWFQTSVGISRLSRLAGQGGDAFVPE